VLFIPPAGLLGIDGEAWLAAGSSSATWGGCQVWISADGVSYQLAGEVMAPARYGTLTAALASAADPDNTNTLRVNLSNSAGTLASVTAAQMNAGVTLALIDNEIVGYQNATLTGANAYDLAPLRRGLYGTTPAAHSTSAKFVRLDDDIYKISYKSLNVGNTLYVKLPSFNLYGRALEDISTVPSYTLSLAALPTLAGVVLTPGSVTRDRIASGAVSGSQSGTQTGSLAGSGSTFTQIATTGSFTLAAAAQVDIFAAVDQAYSGAVKDWGLRIKVDGTAVRTLAYGGGRAGYSEAVSLQAPGVALAAGAHTITIEWAGTDATITASGGQVTAIYRYL
jgi:hypothetical protein